MLNYTIINIFRVNFKSLILLIIFQSLAIFSNGNVIVKNYLPPINTTCATAELLQIGTYNPINYSWVNTCENGGVYWEFECGWPYNNSFLWYKFIAPTSGKVLIKIQTGYTNASLWSSCSNQIYSWNHTNYVAENLNPNQTYYIRLQEPPVSGCEGTICVEHLPSTPVNSECNGAFNKTVDTFENYLNSNLNVENAILVSSQLATIQPDCMSGSVYDVWYSFTAPATGKVFLRLVDHDAYLGFGYSIYSNCNSSTISCGTNGGYGSYVNSIITGLNPGQTYYLQLFSNYEATLIQFSIIELNNTSSPTNDECINAMNLVACQDTVNCDPLNTMYSTFCTESPEPMPSCTYTVDVWGKFTAVDDSYYLNVFSAPNGYYEYSYAVVALYSGACQNLQEISCDYLDETVPFKKITNLIVGNEYYVRILDETFNYLGCKYDLALVPEFGTLPIKLISYSAEKLNSKSLLTWQTTSEKSLSSFSIQRSSDAIDWEDIGKVEAKNEADGVQPYSFIDDQPLKGINYYRLMINDMDGNFEYSPVRSVYFGEGRDGDFEAYGSDKTITIINNSRGNIHYFVYNSLGRIVADTYDTEILVPQSGIFLVSDGISTKKVLVR